MTTHHLGAREGSFHMNSWQRLSVDTIWAEVVTGQSEPMKQLLA